MRKDLTKH